MSDLSLHALARHTLHAARVYGDKNQAPEERLHLLRRCAHLVLNRYPQADIEAAISRESELVQRLVAVKGIAYEVANHAMLLAYPIDPFDESEAL